MKTFAKATLSVCVAAAAVGLFAPKPLVSQYASPVNVMNSKAAPAVTRNTDTAARAPYVSTANGATCTPECGFTPVPANMRLAITHVDALVTIPSSQTLVVMTLFKLGSGDKAFPAFTATAPNGGFTSYITSQAVEYYVDAGGLPLLDAQSTAGSAVPTSVTLTGYLIDCTNGCSAIVH